MGKYIVAFEPNARKDLKAHFKSGNQASIKKITKILEELVDTPYSGVGNPEELKYELSGFWSREINKKDRMIYKVDEAIVTVIVIAAMGHYSDK
jgi:toxin YoeB